MKDELKTDAEKREALRAKIDAAEARHAERSLGEQAKEAADGALEYVKANPIKSVAAVAIGALVIGAMTRPGRKAGKRAGKFASVATDAALAYALSLFDSAEDAADKGQDRLADLTKSARKNAREWQDYAAREGSELSDYLIAAAKRSGKRASKTIEELRSRIAH
jgi:ElaB/YqjD/DUF883 family membrane-anchored ribosome-binding protein